MANMITRSVVTVALGGLVSLGMMYPANAADCPEGTYPPGVQCTAVASTVTSTPPDAPFTYRVGGFKPYSTVHLVLHSTPIDLGTAIADGEGFATFEVRIPGFVPSGEHTLTASGIDPSGKPRILVSALTVTQPIALAASGTTVATPSEGHTGSIPFTGFELGAASLLGFGLLGTGAIAVVTTRRRRTSS